MVPRHRYGSQARTAGRPTAGTRPPGRSAGRPPRPRCSAWPRTRSSRRRWTGCWRCRCSRCPP